MNNFLNSMFGKIAPGMCRLSMNGEIAVKTGSGYKSYNVKNNRLTNCNNFAFDVGEDFFFVIPTNKVNAGDIILVDNKPKCVIKVEKNTITVISYEDSCVQTILPERHVFMGNTYFYGKIVSMFGNDFGKGSKSMKNIMQYMMMSEMLKGNTGTNNGMNSMLPFMMMNNGTMDNIFDGIFDCEEDDENEESEVE